MVLVTLYMYTYVLEGWNENANKFKFYIRPKNLICIFAIELQSLRQFNTISYLNHNRMKSRNKVLYGSISLQYIWL